MTASGWVQLAIYIGLLLALTKPMGFYLLQVLDPDRAGSTPFLEKILGPLERLLYRLGSTD